MKICANFAKFFLFLNFITFGEYVKFTLTENNYSFNVPLLASSRFNFGYFLLHLGRNVKNCGRCGRVRADFFLQLCNFLYCFLKRIFGVNFGSLKLCLFCQTFQQNKITLKCKKIIEIFVCMYIYIYMGWLWLWFLLFICWVAPPMKFYQ